MNAAAARDYLLALITTLKLTEKEISSLESEAAKWESRIKLAHSSGKDDLLTEAEKQTGRIKAKLLELKEEELSLKDNIAAMKRGLPGIDARERSIDPDLLEQELLMTLDNLKSITNRAEDKEGSL